jgi:imidazolonepropionase-like amidohydrolase
MLPLLLAVTSALSGAGVPETASAAAESRSAQYLAIRARRVHTGDGPAIENGVVVVDGAKILVVGADAAVPEGTYVIEHPGEIAPGWIALHDGSGSDGELLDETRPVLSDARTSLGLNISHSDVARLAREGITCVVLGAPDSTLCAGQTAVVKTVGGRVVREPAQLQLSFSSSGLDFNRYPTSYAGAVAELDSLMEAGKGAFGMAKKGELPVLLAANEKHEILRALDFAKRHALKGALYGAPLAGELAEQVRASGLAVVWRPYDAGVERRQLDALAALARASIPFGFALDAPERHPASLRVSAAASIRAGVESDVALRALTSTAASIAGVGQTVGRLAPGLDADLVLWSGNPLDLTSSIQAVYVDGKLVQGDKR